MLDKELKDKIIKKFGKSDKDVGSVEVQIAVMTKRISEITEHLKKFPKDKHSRVGLLRLAGKKKRFAKYLHNADKASFDNMMKQLKTL